MSEVNEDPTSGDPKVIETLEEYVDAAVGAMSAVEELFAEIAQGYGGKQHFYLSGKLFEIVIPKDADSHAKLYEYLQRFQALTPKSAPKWKDWLPVTPAIANRLAHARMVDVRILKEGKPEKLSDASLLKLAKLGGGIFVAMTDEIMGRCQSVITHAEIALTEELGNASPTTPGVG